MREGMGNISIATPIPLVLFWQKHTPALIDLYFHLNFDFDLLLEWNGAMEDYRGGPS